MIAVPSSVTRRELHELLGSRWALAILTAIAPASDSTACSGFRFGELRRALPGVSSRMLSVTARALVAAGLVLREPGDDRTVVYSLTVNGLAVLRWSSAQLTPAGSS